MYVRDKASGAVINTDDSHYKSILLRRIEKQKSAELCKQIEDLQEEMAEIKAMLQKVISGKNYG